MERNDVHSPSNIIPEDYEYVGQQLAKFEGMGSAEFILSERKRISEHMARTGGTYSGHTHGGNCDVCGSVNAIYNVLFYHAKTNTYISVGQDCAATLDAGHVPAFKAFRKRVGDYREAQAGKRKAELLLSDAGLTAAWELYKADGVDLIVDNAGHVPYEERTIRDMVSKLVQYGTISDKAKAYLGTLLNKITNRAEVQAKRTEENASAADAPSGRVTVSGIILTTKEQESEYGTVMKMLLRDDSGFKVWCTVPSGTGQSVDADGRVTYGESAKRGDRISVKVTLTPSPDDAKFAFGKRPTLVKHEAKTNAPIAQPWKCSDCDAQGTQLEDGRKHMMDAQHSVTFPRVD